MARFSGAHWRPIPNNFYRGKSNVPCLLVVHIMQGTLAGTDSWFRDPANTETSAHFGVGKDGTIYQWVDTMNGAWHAENANHRSIGVECEGDTGQKLTAAQVDAVARIYAWAHRRHPLIRMWRAIRPSGFGLAYHALGGAGWGGHLQCPGTPIIMQLPTILAKAKAILNPPPPPPWYLQVEKDLGEVVAILNTMAAKVPAGTATVTVQVSDLTSLSAQVTAEINSIKKHAK